MENEPLQPPKQESTTGNAEEPAMLRAPADATINPYVGFRMNIACCMNSVSLLNPSREISLVFTSLQRAFMWLGMALKYTGSASPYTQSENPASPVLHSVADQTDCNFADRWQEYGTQTARVKDFRAIMSSLIGNFSDFTAATESAGPDYDECLKTSFSALREAKLWLGWELDRIKKEKENLPKTQKVSLPL